MRIYSMKATFGKLEHQVLTLKPGLNIIEAPNEWGKSTWCAFLIAMLYGIDTRSKSTRHQLADKERFLPWSGAPMEGRMDLNWNGRDITIERRTRGRVLLGNFRAYETHTGLDIPELTAENCGLELLGVEREVFTRSGFLRFSDLPVTEDEQLRSRLNALVTTGDESGSGELLERKLKELKNRCRYNKSGLIPQLRIQKEKVEQGLAQWDALEQQIRQLEEQIAQHKAQIHLLENHKAALHYRTSQKHNALLQEAKAARDDALHQMEALRDQVELVDSRDTAAKNIRQLTQLQEELAAIHMQEQKLPSSAHVPQLPVGFAGCTARQAVMQAYQHRDEILSLQPQRNLPGSLSMILGAGLLLAATVLLVFDKALLCGICAGIGLLCLTTALISIHRNKQRLSLYQQRLGELSDLYKCSAPEQWVAAAEQYAEEWEAYADGSGNTAEHRSQLRSRTDALVAKSMALTRGKGLSNALEYWQDILSLWDEYDQAQSNYRQACKHYESLQTLSAASPAPIEEDILTHTEEETNLLLANASRELQRLLSKLGQYQGYAESLGSREALEEQNTRLEQRLQELEKTYAALDFALKSLEQASAQLQRRFAPRIANAAQDILSQLTNGRYNRLTLSQDFSLMVGAQDEDTLRSRHWRSDGTVDQLYLALRLAVARELLPNAPLVLDDAMVRFDNVRLQAALEVLKLEAQNKQVIIFTCQDRERELLPE